MEVDETIEAEVECCQVHVTNILSSSLTPK